MSYKVAPDIFRIHLRLRQFANMLGPRTKTLDGILIDVIEQPLNACSYMLVSSDRSMTLFRLEQPKNVPYKIDGTFNGISIEFKFLQCINAHSPIELITLSVANTIVVILQKKNA